MNREEMKSKIMELKELKGMRAELDDMIATIEDEIKAELTANDTDQMVIDGIKISWPHITGSRFDSTSFKKDHPEVYDLYSRSYTSRRFTIT